MSKRTLRNITVNNINYLWRVYTTDHEVFLWTAHDWNTMLDVYLANNKQIKLQAKFFSDERKEIFPDGSGTLTYKWTGGHGLNLHEPRTVVRIIRYARNQLGWNPEQNNSPLIIRNGYQMLNNMGYQQESKVNKYDD